MDSRPNLKCSRVSIKNGKSPTPACYTSPDIIVPHVENLMSADTSSLQPLEPGLCSWCLHLADEPSLRKAMESFNLRALQLALAPLVELPASEQTHAIA